MKQSFASKKKWLGGASMKRRANSTALFALSAVLLMALALSACGKKSPEPGTVKDEALAVGGRRRAFPRPMKITSRTWTAP